MCIKKCRKCWNRKILICYFRSSQSPPHNPWTLFFSPLHLSADVFPSHRWMSNCLLVSGLFCVLCRPEWKALSLLSLHLYYQPPPFSGGSADLPASCMCVFHAVPSGAWEGMSLTSPLVSPSLPSSDTHSSHVSSPLSLPGGPSDLPAEGEGRLVQWAAAQLRAAASWGARARRRDWQAGEPHSPAGAGLAGQRWVPGEG